MKQLTTEEFKLLSVLGLEEISGRELASAYEKRFKRTIPYGTLYTTMRRLREKGLVNSREDSDRDGRLRLFSVTTEGVSARRAHADFLVTIAGPGLMGAPSHG